MTEAKERRGDVVSANQKEQCARGRTSTRKEKTRMPNLTTRDGTHIYYKDWGSGQPIVFSHGWPLSADAWES
jgi:hypothetical protein